MRHINFQECVDYLVKKRRDQISASIAKNRQTAKQYHAHICAILDKKSGSIIGIGSNRNYSQYKTMYGMIHAEIDALTKHQHKLGRTKVNLLVIRVTGGNSKPCSDCINNFVTRFNSINIKKVFYSNIKDGQYGLSYDNINQLKYDPDMHTSSYYANQHTHCMCNTCNDDTSNSCDSSLDTDNDDDDDEAKGAEADLRPALCV
jgi:cytidine deaminase